MQTINRLVASFLLGMPILYGCSNNTAKNTDKNSAHSNPPISIKKPVNLPRKGLDFRGLQLGLERESLLEEALSLPSTFDDLSEKNFADQQLIEVIGTNEYAITNAKSDKPIIGAYSVANCVALIVYDLKTSNLAVAHISCLTDIQSLDSLFKDLGITNSKKLSNLTVGLIGGLPDWIDSPETAANILMYLKNKGLKPSYADILEKPHPINFAVDARTGEIILTKIPIPYRDYKGNSIGRAPIRKTFDSRK